MHIFGVYRRRRRRRLRLLVGAVLHRVAGVIRLLSFVGAVVVTLFLLDLRLVGVKWWCVVVVVVVVQYNRYVCRYSSGIVTDGWSHVERARHPFTQRYHNDTPNVFLQRLLLLLQQY